MTKTMETLIHSQHLQASTHTYIEIKLNWNSYETETHTVCCDEKAGLPMVYPLFRSLQRGTRRWALVVLFSCTSDVLVLAAGGDDLFKDRLGMRRAGNPWEPMSTDWDFFFSLRGDTRGDMKNRMQECLQMINGEYVYPGLSVLIPHKKIHHKY